MCSDYTSLQSGYRGCSTNLQPSNCDAITDHERDTSSISIHHESYSINVSFLIYRVMDTFVSEINKSIHQNRNKGGKLWDKK